MWINSRLDIPHQTTSPWSRSRDRDEITVLSISTSSNRLSITSTIGGAKWVRAIAGYRKIDGKWRITHEHFSAPFEMKPPLQSLTEPSPKPKTSRLEDEYANADNGSHVWRIAAVARWPSLVRRLGHA